MKLTDTAPHAEPPAWAAGILEWLPAPPERPPQAPALPAALEGALATAVGAALGAEVVLVKGGEGPRRTAARGSVTLQLLQGASGIWQLCAPLAPSPAPAVPQAQTLGFSLPTRRS